MALPSGQIQADDDKDHYTVIILGAGMSGLATAIQLKQKLGLTDVMIYEKDDEIGGTWNANRYPGVACDVAFSFYSFSFAPPKQPCSEAANQKQILAYLKDVQQTHKNHNIRFLTQATHARHSRADGLWHVTLDDLATGQTRHRTCNFLFSCQGALSVPKDPPFDTSRFAGKVFHSAEWDKSVDLGGKDVVVLGNACTGTQLIPAIIEQTKSLTQVCWSKQTIISPGSMPWWAQFGLKWIPGFHYPWRWYLFWFLESIFPISDTERGADMRAAHFKATQDYMKRTAPEKYWTALTPEFELSTKRRVIDYGYLAATNDRKFDLVQGDSIARAEGHTVTTTSGREVPADVVILCTGFKVSDLLAPLEVTNDEGENLVEKLRGNGYKAYRGTVVSGFPNFFWLLGPNTSNGHSSVIFTAECQAALALGLIQPLLPKLTAAAADKAAAGPTVEVTAEAEDRYYAKVRGEMRKKLWEQEGVQSWYGVTGADGRQLCTAVYPWSQADFWWYSRRPVWKHFRVTG